MSEEEFDYSGCIYDALVVGMGAAGVGVSAALKHAEIENFMGLDRQMVGASFARWPKEMRFITPSFPTNSVGMVDINSVALGTSPAYGLQVEHPTGLAFASYLNNVVDAYDLPVLEQIDVKSITKEGDLFHLETSAKTLKAKHVVWAGGDFQYPNLNGFEGCEHCRHIATIPSYAGMKGDEFIVIGGYESGIDAAYHLAQRGKRVRVFDEGCPWEAETSDPSIALSPYTLERLRSETFQRQVDLFPNTPVEAVLAQDSGFQVTTAKGQNFKTPIKPILATGFAGSHTLISHLFEKREDGYPLLSEHDESTLVPGIFLCGPAVRHEGEIFCFIYKYRQRFAVVAKRIATSLGLPAEVLEMYRDWGMYLDDLSCCGEECVC
mgnify:CR=1 FL=1